MGTAISSMSVQILTLGLIMVSMTEWLTLLADSIELNPFSTEVRKTHF